MSLLNGAAVIPHSLLSDYLLSGSGFSIFLISFPTSFVTDRIGNASAGAVILMQLIGSFSVNGHKPEIMQSRNKDWEVSYEEKQ